MTPGARIQAVIELLDAIQSGNEPTDRLIDAYFRKRRFAGSGDRRNVNQTVYEILRHRADIAVLDAKYDSQRIFVVEQTSGYAGAMAGVFPREMGNFQRLGRLPLRAFPVGVGLR